MTSRVDLTQRRSSYAHVPSAAVSPPGCRMCAVVQNKSRIKDVIDSPLAETENFVAIPSLGSLVEGWLLLVPRRHSLSLAGLTPEEERDAADFEQGLVGELGRAYGPLVRFEHGAAIPGSAIGCSVDHAHLHFVPTRHDILTMARRLSPEVSWRTSSFTSYADLRRNVFGSEYVRYTDQRGQTQIGTGAIPSQLLRRAIATAEGRPGYWDWRAHPFTETAKQTATTLHANRNKDET